MAKTLTFRRVLWDLLCLELAVLLVIVAPCLLGKFCGHGWGLVAGAGAILGWVYFGRKMSLFECALSTRIIWLLGLVVIVCEALFEFACLSGGP
jgi:hypothetical protein